MTTSKGVSVAEVRPITTGILLPDLPERHCTTTHKQKRTLQTHGAGLAFLLPQNNRHNQRHRLPRRLCRLPPPSIPFLLPPPCPHPLPHQSHFPVLLLPGRRSRLRRRQRPLNPWSGLRQRLRHLRRHRLLPLLPHSRPTRRWRGGTAAVEEHSYCCKQSGGLKHFVISTLPSAEGSSGGRLEVPHFDFKARVASWIRGELPGLWEVTTEFWSGIGCIRIVWRGCRF